MTIYVKNEHFFKGNNSRVKGVETGVICFSSYGKYERNFGEKQIECGFDGGEGGIRTHGSQRLHTLSRRA